MTLQPAATPGAPPILRGEPGNVGVLGDLLAQVAYSAGAVTWTGTFDFGEAGAVTLSIRDVDVNRLSEPARDLLLVTAARLATLGLTQQGMWPAVSLSPEGGCS